VLDGCLAQQDGIFETDSGNDVTDDRHSCRARNSHEVSENRRLDSLDDLDHVVPGCDLLSHSSLGINRRSDACKARIRIYPVLAERRAGGEDRGPVERPGGNALAPCNMLWTAMHVPHGGNASGDELGKVLGAPEMHVHVGKPGKQKLSASVNAPRADRNPSAVRGPDPFDTIAPHENGVVAKRSVAGHRNHSDVLDGEISLARLRCNGRRLKCEREQCRHSTNAHLLDRREHAAHQSIE
jgi:hypothetical protein